MGIGMVISAQAHIGEGVFIGNHVTIRRGCVIGDRVVIGHNVVLEEDCIIGDDTRIQAAVYLAKGTKVGNKVFIGPMVCTTNDKRILSHNRGEFAPNAPVIEFGVRIGARALIMPGVKIGKNALIGAGSIITEDVGEEEVWYGDKAIREGYVLKRETLNEG